MPVFYYATKGIKLYMPNIYYATKGIKSVVQHATLFDLCLLLYVS